MLVEVDTEEFILKKRLLSAETEHKPHYTRIEIQLYEALQRIKQETGTPVNDLINNLIEAMALKYYDKRYPLNLEYTKPLEHYLGDILERRTKNSN